MNDLEQMYEEYLYYFDPTPQYLYDEPDAPLEFDEWLESLDDE